jgi:hypothetical protein
MVGLSVCFGGGVGFLVVGRLVDGALLGRSVVGVRVGRSEGSADMAMVGWFVRIRLVGSAVGCGMTGEGVGSSGAGVGSDASTVGALVVVATLVGSSVGEGDGRAVGDDVVSWFIGVFVGASVSLTGDGCG